ncbi:MAG: helix-turn-helix domain-containing protein, partial [Myxococcaceae bacterium]
MARAKIKIPEVEDARAALLAQARAAFASGGSAAVEVVPICKAAGLTTGALYHHFGNRNGLLRAVVEAVADQQVMRRHVEDLRVGGGIIFVVGRDGRGREMGGAHGLVRPKRHGQRPQTEEEGDVLHNNPARMYDREAPLD